MSEEDVRGGLRDAVAEEPPLEFDADALVATARHQAKRRRALMAVGAATVAVAVVAVALPAVFGRGPAPVADRPASTATTSTTTTSTSTRTPDPATSRATPDRYTEDELRRRSQQMASHLLRRMPSVLPDASAFEVGEFGGEATGHFYDGQTYVNAPVSFTIDGARYSIFVTVWVPGVADPSPATVCAVTCQRLGEKDGGQLVGTTDSIDAKQLIRTVYHFRTNGGVVQIAGYNYDLAGAVAYQQTVPMTLDQLTALATDPDLGL